MFYIIETEYVGGNRHEDAYADADYIVISSKPAYGNLSGEPIISGWCGNENASWQTTAHGQYDTIEDARAAIAEIFGDVRLTASLTAHAVETYRPGKYRPISGDQVGDWAYEFVKNNVTAETTDEQIKALVAECEKSANSEGYTLPREITTFMEEFRAELRDQDENDE